MTTAASRTTGRQPAAGRSSASPGPRTSSTPQTDEPAVRHTLLPGGLRVVTEHVPGARSAAVGVWIAVGSRDETPRLHGASHFLEHLLFKGTRRRSALDISVALDDVGGEMNAFTAKEYTCFHARVLDADLPLAVDVLGDMITGSVLDPAEVEAERDVILDEIAMHDDDPDDVVHDLLAELAWGSSTALGRSIAGSEASITALTREQVRRFHRRHYRPAAMVVAVAADLGGATGGGLDHDAVAALVHEAFDHHGFLDATEEPLAPRRSARPLRVRSGTVRATRPFEQVNLVLAHPGLDRHDERRYALGVLSTALGGGTSSRLFQEVRERRGLAYAVWSSTTHHADTGLVGVSVGCLPDRVDDVLRVVREQLADVAAHGIGDDELRRGQAMLRSGLLLGLEDTGSRMSRIGKAALVQDRLLPVDDVLARIDAVTTADVAALARETFSRPEVLAVVGPEPS